MSELFQLQTDFARLLPRLIDEIYLSGYECTLGEAWRPAVTVEAYARRGIGSRNSLHPDRLAIDINLFRNGIYLTKTSDHAKFGEYWKSLHPLARWGGDFKTRPDGNHYSLEYRGRQ